jgi:predicted metal-binding membrane protein
MMAKPARRPEAAWLVVLASIGLAAWSMLALGESELSLPAFCAAGVRWPAPPSLSLDLALMLHSPAKLAADWALMAAAMMSPLLVAPLRHVRDRSFVSRRRRAMLLFIAGYAAVWMIAGVALQAVALTTLWAVPAPLLCLGVAAAAATLWQVSPAKQGCLNRCHRQPQLAAFGAAADRDAIRYGLTNGASCAGACWALMLLMLLVGHAHLGAMIAVTLFVFAERLESPAPRAWRCRGAGKALRIAAAQTRMQLAPQRRIREVSP